MKTFGMFASEHSPHEAVFLNLKASTLRSLDESLHGTDMPVPAEYL